MPPQWSGLGAQAAIYYGARSKSSPVEMAAWDSIVAVEAKAQHEPQWPWSLTAETTPCWRQSTEVGRSAMDLILKSAGRSFYDSSFGNLPFARPWSAFFSVVVKWLMWFTVSVHVAFELL